MHSLLVATSDQFRPGDIDYCLSDIVFDHNRRCIRHYWSGKGRRRLHQQDEGGKRAAKATILWNTSLRQSLSTKRPQLVRPLREILKGKLDLRAFKKVDELLRRVMVGLSRNVDAQDRRVLVFTHQLIRSTYDGQDKQQGEIWREKHD